MKCLQVNDCFDLVKIRPFSAKLVALKIKLYFIIKYIACFCIFVQSFPKHNICIYGHLHGDVRKFKKLRNFSIKEENLNFLEHDSV